MKKTLLLSVIFTITLATITPAQTLWNKYQGNPVLELGHAGSWDAMAAELGTVLYLDGTYHMYYGGYDGLHYRIGHATSTDGINWTKDPLNPVLDVGAPGSWEESSVYVPCIVHDGTTFHLYYDGAQGWIENVGHATSTDGSNFTKDPANPVLTVGPSGSWDDTQVFPMSGSVIYENNTFRMWYGGGNVSNVWQIGYASSSDGTNWTKGTTNPVITPGPQGSWDDVSVIPGTVYNDGEKYYIWYSGSSYENRWRTGLATSADGTVWEKNPCCPVLDYGPMGSWDNYQAWNAAVIFDNTAGTYKMWYTGGGWNAGRMGYATGQSQNLLRVPCDYLTIQEAIDAAGKGDMVLVEPGTWVENINFKGKAITVASRFILEGDTNYINSTIIDGSNPSHPDTAAVVTFASNEDTASIICGFTISGGSGNLTFTPPVGEIVFGGGICCNHAGAKIINNKIFNNNISHENAACGAGIGTSESGNSWCIIRDNIIKDNHLSATDIFAAGGGISLNGKGIIEDNVIENNKVYCSESLCYGGGLYVEAYNYYPGDSAIIRNNQLTSNIAEGYGTEVLGGAIMVWFATPTIQNNIITQNEVLGDGNICYGAGISICKPYGKVVLADNYIADNNIPGYVMHVGAGFHLWFPFDTLLIRDNVIINNRGESAYDGLGGGICLLDTKNEWVELEGNRLCENEARAGGGIFFRNAFNTHMVNNLFHNNDAYWGGGLYITQQETPQNFYFGIVNNTFRNNHAGDRGGGIRLNGDSGHDIITFNNLFWENEAINMPGSNSISSGASSDLLQIYYSDINPEEIEGNWEGDFNIYQDPLFCDDSCHLDCATPSPCIESGASELEVSGITYYAPPKDLDGDSRPLDNTYDIGADEMEICSAIAEHGPEEGKLNLTVVPNPTNGILHLQYSTDQSSPVSLQVVNLTGKILETHHITLCKLEEQHFTLNLSHLPDGVYLLRLQAGNEVASAKVVLNK